MFAPALRIALSKATLAAEREALEAAIPVAELLQRIETEFESKINASKAARGEKPTKLSKARKAQVQGHAEDAISMQSEQLAHYQAALSAREIVGALHAGLFSDLRFWSTAEKYIHPADMPVVNEFVHAKKQVLQALKQCLSASATNAA